MFAIQKWELFLNYSTVLSKKTIVNTYAAYILHVFKSEDLVNKGFLIEKTLLQLKMYSTKEKLML